MQKANVGNKGQGDARFSTSDSDCSKLAVVRALGSASFYPDRDADIIQELIGATIVNFGMPDGGNIEGGGLVIDYLPSGSNVQKRIVFAFNDCGIWVDFKA